MFGTNSVKKAYYITFLKSSRIKMKFSVYVRLFAEKYLGFSILDIFFVQFSKGDLLFNKKACKIHL